MPTRGHGAAEQWTFICRTYKSNKSSARSSSSQSRITTLDDSSCHSSDRAPGHTKIRLLQAKPQPGPTLSAKRPKFCACGCQDGFPAPLSPSHWLLWFWFWHITMSLTNHGGEWILPLQGQGQVRVRVQGDARANGSTHLCSVMKRFRHSFASVPDLGSCRTHRNRNMPLRWRL